MGKHSGPEHDESAPKGQILEPGADVYAHLLHPDRLPPPENAAPLPKAEEIIDGKAHAFNAIMGSDGKIVQFDKVDTPPPETLRPREPLTTAVELGLPIGKHATERAAPLQKNPVASTVA